MSSSSLAGRSVLITGAARRIGAEIARRLHAEGMHIAVHYNRSDEDANALKASLETTRANSVSLHRCNLLEEDAPRSLVAEVLERHGALHALINNASSFYPTPIGAISTEHWDDLMGTNLKAPLFLSQAAAPALQAAQGCIVNLADIYALRPLRAHPVYTAAKAGLLMLTQSLALDLAPSVRVNAIAPGAILWPSTEAPSGAEPDLSAIPLERMGSPADIANGVVYLLKDASYTTGTVLTVDGGRRIAGY